MQKYKFKVSGMHCAACEITLEKVAMTLPGAVKARASTALGGLKIYAEREPDLAKLNSLLADTDYRVFREGESLKTTPSVNRWSEIGALALLLLSVYILLKKLDLLPEGFGIKEEMSYGFVFLLGLVAAFSTCMAVTGGLLVSISTRLLEQGMKKSFLWRAQLSFNFGRIISYSLLGGLVGVLGSSFSLSPKMSGLITIIASFAMMILGVQMLGIFPKLGLLGLKMPKIFGHFSHHQAKSGGAKPFVLGALTFFLPCGFTQALQLYVLSQGGFVLGMLTMGIFALGTLPGLLSVGAMANFLQGTAKRYFVTTAGLIVIVLGIFGLNGGANLLGVGKILAKAETPVSFNLPKIGEKEDNTTIKNKVKMKVEGYDYFPANFTVLANTDIEWVVDGANAAGCARILILPDLDIQEILPQKGTKTIKLNFPKPGFYPFYCAMGMTTPGAGFEVRN
ncbi:sulfite exporter TauE/SafE family protein [Candidatus Microgenomates bacterium]|nr:sulfite exporter TauE/SafE family protein [Candidatus Microgenomates bacterium]